MDRREAKNYIEEILDDTLENINFKLSMDTELSFEEIADLIAEVWEELRSDR